MSPQDSTAGGNANRYYGKYRGLVVNNIDPLQIGRIMVQCADVLGEIPSSWALPCVPAAGIQAGMFIVPPIGSQVWIEFEQGNPDKPIWSGCYWETAEEPLMPELAPEAPELVNVLKSKFCTLVLDDTPETGGITLSVIDPAVAVPVTLTMTSAGLAITVGPTSVLVSAEAGIKLEVAEVVTTMTEEAVATEAPAITLTAEESVDITAEAVGVQGDVNVTGPVEVEGTVGITAAVEIGGALSVEGASEFAGEVNVTGALTAEGDVNVAGAAEVEGEFNVLGAMTAEGDVNVAGATQFEGNVALLGVGEGIWVPGF
jgi:cytoskeletal protein CcmA (bactofilin family)